jgi:hypothetical protein
MSIRKVGDRVRWEANLSIGAGTGTVVRIFEAYTYADDGEVIEAPEKASVRYDVRPVPWPYAGNKFAPDSSRLTVIGEE